MNFHHTRHFRFRLEQRKLFLHDVESVVRGPDQKIQQRRGTHGGFVIKYRKTVGGKTLCVIAETWKDDCWLLTAYKPDEP